MKIKKCIRCLRFIDQLEHGNRLRCKLCAILHKREYNRNKQRIIREIGKPGLKNFQLLEQITSSHNWDENYKTTINQMVRRGFDFSQGGKTYDSTSHPNYKVILIMHYAVYYNPNDPGKSVTIIKKQTS